MKFKAKARFLSICGAILTLAGCSAAAPRASALSLTNEWVLGNVTVVDVRTGALSPNRAIIIRDDRIRDIVAADMAEEAGLIVKRTRLSPTSPGDG